MTAPRDDIEPLSPEGVEAAIDRLRQHITRGVRVVSDAERDASETRAAHDRAFAAAYLAYEGPAHARKYAAELSTIELRDARDVADLAYRHAKRVAESLESELRAYQSIGKSVTAMYGATTGFGS